MEIVAVCPTHEVLYDLDVGGFFDCVIPKICDISKTAKCHEDGCTSKLKVTQILEH